MSDWKETDEITTTVGSIWLSQNQAYAAGVAFERERIIKLLEENLELQRDLYFWLEFGDHDKHGSEHKANAIALIKEGNDVE